MERAFFSRVRALVYAAGKHIYAVGLVIYRCARVYKKSRACLRRGGKNAQIIREPRGEGGRGGGAKVPRLKIIRGFICARWRDTARDKDELECAAREEIIKRGGGVW